MNRGFFLLCLMSFCSQAEATRYGPDAYPYVGRDNTYTFAFEDISGSGTRILNGTDESSVEISIPFLFQFYGGDYDQINISTNGLMSFGGAITSGVNVNTDFAPSPNVHAIYVLWDDWHFIPNNDGLGCCSDADGVYWEVKGTTPNQRLIVQWNRAYGVTSSPESVTFEAILFENTNRVVFQYQDVTSGDTRNSGASATVGIRRERSEGSMSVSIGCFSACNAGGGTNCASWIRRSFNSGVITASTTLEWIPADTPLGRGTCFTALFTDDNTYCGVGPNPSGQKPLCGITYNPITSVLTGHDCEEGGYHDGAAENTDAAVDCIPSQFSTFNDLNTYINRFNLESLIPVPHRPACNGYTMEDITVDHTNGDYFIVASPVTFSDFTEPFCNSSLIAEDVAVFRFDSNSNFLSRFEIGTPSVGNPEYEGIAYDPTTDNLFAIKEKDFPFDGCVIDQLTKTGTLVATYTIDSSVFPDDISTGNCNSISINPYNDRFWITATLTDEPFPGDRQSLFELNRNFTTIHAIYPFRYCSRSVRGQGWNPSGEAFYMVTRPRVTGQNTTWCRFRPREVIDATFGKVGSPRASTNTCGSYTMSSITNAFEDISSTGTRVLENQDDEVIAITLPFTFSFYGDSQLKVYFSDNGIMAFDSVTPDDFSNINLTSDSVTAPLIAAYWGDFIFNGTGSDAAYHEIKGTSPNRRLIIQWNNLSVWPGGTSGDNLTFEAVLYETSNIIEVHFSDATTDSPYSEGDTATVGIANTGGDETCTTDPAPSGCEFSCTNDGVPFRCENREQFSFDTPGAVLDATAIRFTPTTTECL